MLAHYDDLRDKHVLITGGAGGIGAGVTEAFVAQGSRVSALDRDDKAGRAIAARLGDAVRFHHADLTDEHAITTALNDAQRTHGPVDVLINNAGYDPRYDVTSMSTQEWDDLFALNVRHYFLTARALLPSMIARRGGSIIMVASCECWIGSPRMVCYVATKTAIQGMVKSLAREVGKHSIRVNAIAPGWVMTERQMRDMITLEQKQSLIHEWQSLPVELTPALIAGSFLFLASDASIPITRQTILVDGGLAES